jgi:hypothetical protein
VRHWGLLLAVAGGLVAGAFVGGAPAAPAVAPTFTLVTSPKCNTAGGEKNVGRGCVNPTATAADKWTYGDGNAKWDVPGQWVITYEWTIPATVPAAGANLTMKLAATERIGGPNNRICPAMGAASGFGLQGAQPQAIGFCAEAGGTVTQSKTLKMVASPAQPPGSLLYLQIGLQDGPHYTYTYKGAAASGGCRKPAAVSPNAPSASGKVTFHFTHHGVPKRGESPTLVGSSTAGQGSFSICGDPYKGWVKGTAAKGAIGHVDRHAHLGRTATDRLSLSVIGARIRVFGGAVGRISGELFVKVTASNDPQCKVGSLGSINLGQTVASTNSNSALDMSVCRKAHDHTFQNDDSGRSGDVSVAIRFLLPK